jgi:stachydrine N-demethylase
VADPIERSNQQIRSLLVDSISPPLAPDHQRLPLSAFPFHTRAECYHCAANHPELRRSFPASSSGSLPTQTEAAFAERAEGLGLPSAFVRSDDYQYRATRLQLVNSARSMTMDGTPAVREMRLGRMPLEDVGDVLFYHYPTTWNHWLVDHALSFRALPVSPTETEIVTTWLVPIEAREGVDYDLQTLTEVWEATNQQDLELVEAVQLGVSSPAFTPGPYSTQHEEGVIDFIDWYEHSIRRHAAH